jgi:drug/metabolite transporter (DMT)-like permease
MKANLYALGAIALWASLATLGVSLTHIPPFLLTGLGLLIGSIPSWPFVWRDPQQWRLPLPTLALGIYGLFAYHFLLFMALRHAPPIEANLVNYLWPLLIVLLSPILLPGTELRGAHIVAALMGFAGAALAIAGGRELSGTLAWGYIPALAAAFIWSSYSLLTRRVPHFPTTAIGLFGLVSGVLSLACHVVLEPSVSLASRDWLLLIVLGLGPLGAAFFMWDKAIKLGDTRHIGILSYLTPLASTTLLVLTSDRPFTLHLALATLMILSAAVLVKVNVQSLKNWL